jgi:hypothetical protein
VLCNLLSKLSFNYHPSHIGKRALQLQHYDWSNLHENLLKLINLSLCRIQSNPVKPTPELQAETLSFTLMCLKNYLFFELALKNTQSDEIKKKNVSFLIMENENLSKIYSTL